MSPPATPFGPAVVRLTLLAGAGPTLADLKTITLGHLEGGGTDLVLDLRAAGPLDRRAVGTLMYVLALYHEAGGVIHLCVTPEQRGTLAPYIAILHLTECSNVSSNPPVGDGAAILPTRDIVLG